MTRRLSRRNPAHALGWLSVVCILLGTCAGAWLFGLLVVAPWLLR